MIETEAQPDALVEEELGTRILGRNLVMMIAQPFEDRRAGPVA